MAEEWAKKNGLKFPPIDAEAQFKKYGLKEFYVFRDPTDSSCPTIIHFPLVNKTFKEQSAPGINVMSISAYIKLLTYNES